VSVSITVFFNLGSAEPTGSANSLQGSVRILKLALFLASRFRQKSKNVSKVPQLEKGWKTLLYNIKLDLSNDQRSTTATNLESQGGPYSQAWFFSELKKHLNQFRGRFRPRPSTTTVATPTAAPESETEETVSPFAPTAPSAPRRGSPALFKRPAAAQVRNLIIFYLTKMWPIK